MAIDHIRYDLMTQDALRGVLRRVLVDAAKKGIPGEHHFYITFLTGAEGVKISARLREKFPNEITIILQHQFWDLVVRDESFDVGLSFGGVSEKLSVPFAAIQGFFDPSVQFGLSFENADKSEAVSPGKAAADSNATSAKAAPSGPPQAEATAKPPASPALKIVEEEAKATAGGAEVVRLDRFRKK